MPSRWSTQKTRALEHQLVEDMNVPKSGTIDDFPTTLNIYVPVPKSTADRTIRPGSGIVGRDVDDQGRLIIFFEGNLYHAVGLGHYDARVRVAAGRLLFRYPQSYPTVAKMLVPVSQVLAVGTFDVATKSVRISDQRTVDRYLYRIPKGGDRVV